MASIGDQLITAMVAALNAPAGKPLPTVRQRPRPVGAENQDGSSGIDAMLLYTKAEQSKRVSANRVKRERTIALEIPIAGTADDGPLDAAADPRYVFAVNTLFADPTFGGLCLWLEEVSVNWEVASDYLDIAVTLLELKVVFETTVDPSVLP